MKSVVALWRIALVLAGLGVLNGCRTSTGPAWISPTDGKAKPQGAVKTGNGETPRNGWFRSWHRNGQLREEGLYVHGQMHGPWSIYDEYGRKRGLQNYSKGQRHGQWLSWHANGRLARRWQYDHGKKHGDWLTWDEKGNLSQRESYNHDIKQP